ncbi:MAG: hypothetical protein F6J87_18355 [Spirulina sp. SIO3F2]|nr:hypothetical protein [Spirulina sp. SIO3F2]
MQVLDAFPNATFVPAAGGNPAKVSIPIADLGLTAAQADPATGDIRAIIQQFLRRVTTAYNNANPKPNAMTVALGNPIGQGTNQIARTHTLTFPRRIDEDDLALLPAAN